MRRTLQQLIDDFYMQIGQTSDGCDFTSSQITGFINNSIQFIATLIMYPRDIIEIQVQDGYASYTKPTDFISAINAYFGDRGINGDCIPISIVTTSIIKEIYPNWLDSTRGSKGTPKYCVDLDQNTFLLQPRPNADSSVTGKKLYIEYNYDPAMLSASGDYPDLPPVYHQCIPLYCAHLAYGTSKTPNPELSKIKKNDCIEKVKAVQPQVTNMIQNFMFYFVESSGYNEDVSLAYNRIL